MKKSQIAAQCYTVRNYLHTPSQVDRSFAKLREIGFEAIQISGTAVDPKEIKKYADANGLKICAIHDNMDKMVDTPEVIIEKLDLYDCKHTAYPCPWEYIVIDEPSVIDLAHKLNDAAEVYAAAGKKLSYHNHNLEFRKVNGKLIFDLIYEHAPKLLAEIDTYWVAMGGCDPVEYIEKLSGRQEIFHLKDLGIIYPSEATMVPIGEGNLRWDRIMPAAEAAGVEWFIIEQDRCQIDPFESLKISYNYLAENFAE